MFGVVVCHKQHCQNAKLCIAGFQRQLSFVDDPWSADPVNKQSSFEGEVSASSTLGGGFIRLDVPVVSC